MRAGARPTVALLAHPGTTAAVRPLVRGLSRHAEVRSMARADRPDVVLATHPDAAVGLAPGCPVAVVDAGQVVVRGVEGRVAGPPLALPGPHTVTSGALAPLAPHVRRRWRERLGLDPDLVVDTVALDPVDVPTALAVAAAAVVDLRDLPTALALGCPTVTDPGAARQVGAEPGRDLEVGGRPEAVALAADPIRAARLSRRARHLAVTRLDPEVVARSLLDACGLVDASAPAARVHAALSAMGTAPTAPVRRRVDAALDLFAPAP